MVLKSCINYMKDIHVLHIDVLPAKHSDIVSTVKLIAAHRDHFVPSLFVSDSHTFLVVTIFW